MNLETGEGKKRKRKKERKRVLFYNNCRLKCEETGHDRNK
jgi:hypothetical protein